MKPSRRLEKIPPYAFAQLERKIAEKRAAGADVISLGIGDPDRPTPALIVEAMQEAVSEAETHQYPSNRGRADFRGAVRDFYERRFDVRLDPEREIIPAIGAKEAIFNLNLAFLDPGDYALAADPGYPVYTGGPWLAGAEPVLMALRPELGFVPDLGAIDEDVARKAKLMYLNYPNNPTGAVVPEGFFERVVSSPVPTRSWSSTTTPTRRSSSTATGRPRSWRPPARRTSGSRSSRSPRATT